jgi:hypothetical protein
MAKASCLDIGDDRFDKGLVFRSRIAAQVNIWQPHPVDFQPFLPLYPLGGFSNPNMT